MNAGETGTRAFSTPNGWTFSWGADYEIIGSYPEMVEANNPRGEWWGIAYFIEACNSKGEVYAHNGRWDTPDGASAAAAAFAGRNADPEKLDVLFSFNRNAYGSPAYERDGDEQGQIEREADPQNWI